MSALLKATNTMSPKEKFIDFGVCIGIPDSKHFSFLNRFIVKPIDWLLGSENSKKVPHYICHVVARIIAISGFAFAAIDVGYNILITLGKLPLAILKQSGIKKIPNECSFEGILENLKNLGQSLALTLTVSFGGIARPDLIGKFAYPISARHHTPILGYHEINYNIANAWTISPKLFEFQLEHLYKQNYELCTFKEFLEGYTPSIGKRLAVITFDDSHESQFKVNGTDELGNLAIDENCAIGIMEKVKKRHPGFRCVATFFVNTSDDQGTVGNHNHTIFADASDQKSYTARKLRHLLDNGHEVGSHGHHHRWFHKLSKEELAQDILDFDQTIEQIKEAAKNNDINLDDLEIVSFAWPHGKIPSKEKRALFDKRFKYIADFGFNSGKVKQKTFLEDPNALKAVPRIYIGPNTGFEQYTPK
jgi:peptidoglycan/xylan/chitin deacetylase (PgdA/CDA1 family)